MTFLIDVNAEYTKQQSSTLKPVSSIAQIAKEFQQKLELMEIK